MGYKLHPFCWSTTSCSESPQQKKICQKRGRPFPMTKIQSPSSTTRYPIAGGFLWGNFPFKMDDDWGVTQFGTPPFLWKKKHTHIWVFFKSEHLYMYIYIYIRQKSALDRLHPPTSSCPGASLGLHAVQRQLQPNAPDEVQPVPAGVQRDFQWDFNGIFNGI